MGLVVKSYLSLSFSKYLLSFLCEFHLRHSEDGADFNIFILSLSLSLQRDYFDTRKMALVVMSYLSPSFSKYLLSFLREFHLRHSEDGANFNIFILSLSLSHQRDDIHIEEISLIINSYTISIFLLISSFFSIYVSFTAF